MMEAHLGYMLIAVVSSINCQQNISRLHADMDYIQTNFERSLRLLESVVQSQSAFNASLARLEQRQDSLNASLADLGQLVSNISTLLTGNCQSRTITTNCFTDCLDFRARSFDTSRVITTLGQDGECSQESYCNTETDGGGWTVFQRHQSDAVNFTRGWMDYKYGFGNLSDSFWWGNDKLAQALNDGRQYELRIDLFDWEGEHVYAKYSHFTVAPESDKYRIRLNGYTGNAGDLFREDHNMFWHRRNGRYFSTFDRDNDGRTGFNCAARYGGGGFWFGERCGDFSPNGRYRHTSRGPAWRGLHWYPWREWTYSLKAVSMMYRPTN